jgi:hypothetical protein
MRFIRACDPNVYELDGDRWFEAFSARVDEIVEARLLDDAMAEMLSPEELYVTGR